jgi:hypothetical protein
MIYLPVQSCSSESDISIISGDAQLIFFWQPSWDKKSYNAQKAKFHCFQT